MAYRFTINNRGGDSATLTAEAVILRAGSDRAEPAVAVRISGGAQSRLIYVPLDRVEELVTGIRDTARHAAAEFRQDPRSV
ncbi:hypothetical protein ABT215_09490 [Streptomyces sp900105755]|uniref:Uncharacterized protein n=1 Tax=Streptomyces doudnae TaxID=3075536 RepID=A0ABD5EKQ2_9ACTN|nr:MULTISPECIES: hypothetical protein [unclassified Streptomyces]MDT0435190.1 hypothetical protein [Streptomyces sp. DSM 41981]MYQ65413.1 hypothetical protein [Streptomyces sp. SID4950]SCD99089.1 hypothetical protein GA0115242_118889 [Streptomyces sp. SolWspMP-5a-2]